MGEAQGHEGCCGGCTCDEGYEGNEDGDEAQGHEGCRGGGTSDEGHEGNESHEGHEEGHEGNEGHEGHEGYEEVSAPCPCWYKWTEAMHSCFESWRGASPGS